MEPRFIHKSSVGLSQRQLAALFTDKVESRICARPFVRKPRAPRSIRSHSRNKMLEPAIIEASMNLDIEHILSDSEEKKTFVFHNHNISIYLILLWLFFPNLKQRLYAKWRTEKRQFSAPFFAQLLKKKTSIFLCQTLQKVEHAIHLCCTSKRYGYSTKIGNR